MKSLIPIRDISTFKPLRIEVEIPDRGTIVFGGADCNEDDARIVYTEANFSAFMRNVMDEEAIWKKAFSCPIAGKFAVRATNDKYATSLVSLYDGTDWGFTVMVFDPEAGADEIRSVNYDTASNRVELHSNFKMDEVNETYNVSIPYLAKYSNLIRKSIFYHDNQSPSFISYNRIGFVVDKLNVIVLDEPYCAANGINAIDTATTLLKSVPDGVEALIVVQNYAPPAPKKKTAKKTTTVKKPATKKATTTKKETTTKKSPAKKTTTTAKKSTTTKTTAAKKTTTKKPTTKKTSIKKEESNGKA